MLDNIDFGKLEDPQETAKQRKVFCARASRAKPVIDEILTRMLREVGRRYFGKSNEKDIAVANGAISFAEMIKEQVMMLDAEHSQKPEENIDIEPVPLNSNSDLSI